MVSNQPIAAKKTIALIAHDHRKQELLDWVIENRAVLQQHTLCGTKTTALMLQEKTGLQVKAFLSGPLGGDQQVGADIAEGKIDVLLFFFDPLTAQPHDPDVKALLRIAVLYDIPVANNRATADFLIHSYYINQVYPRKMVDYSPQNQERIATEEQIKAIPFHGEKGTI